MIMEDHLLRPSICLGDFNKFHNSNEIITKINNQEEDCDMQKEITNSISPSIHIISRPIATTIGLHSLPSLSTPTTIKVTRTSSTTEPSDGIKPNEIQTFHVSKSFIPMLPKMAHSTSKGDVINFKISNVQKQDCGKSNKGTIQDRVNTSNDDLLNQNKLQDFEQYQNDPLISIKELSVDEESLNSKTINLNAVYGSVRIISDCSMPETHQKPPSYKKKLVIRTDSITVRRKKVKISSEITTEQVKPTTVNKSTCRQDVNCDSVAYEITTSPSSNQDCTSAELNESKIQSEKDILSPKEKIIGANAIFFCDCCGNYCLLNEGVQYKNNYYCSNNCSQEQENIVWNEKDNGICEDAKIDEDFKTDLVMKEKCDISVTTVPAVPFPWKSGVQLFCWHMYMKHVKSISYELIAAPANLWDVPYPSISNPFKPGMKLEAVDPFHQSLFCVVTIQDVKGYRVRIHFDGYSALYDFWCNADSFFLFPMGFCIENGIFLNCPPSILNFTWDAYLEHCNQQNSNLLPKFKPLSNNDSHFCIGMKLEAEDRKNCAICVATVSDVIGSRILVTFDGWERIYDTWFESTSPFIHPIGWAQKNGLDLCAPKDDQHPECFNWLEYLQKTASKPAPVKAFIPREPKNFRTGMKIEAVDKRNPILLRVASVVAIDGYSIKIHFDGWDDIYDYWVDDDSPDIHPPFWCQRTCHPLEPPLTQQQCALNVDSGVGCGTPGCKGFGHAKGLIYDKHHTIHGCPYSLQNLNADSEYFPTDRLESVPIKKGAAKKTIDLHRNGSPCDDDTQGKRVRKRRRFFDEITEALPAKSNKIEDNSRKSPSVLKQTKPVKTPPPTALNEIISSISHKSVFSLAHSPHKEKRFLPNLGIDKLSFNDVQKLKPLDVKTLVENINSSTSFGDIFVEHDIDGIAFLMLEQSDLTNVLKIRLGPSKKIMLCIERLKSLCKS